MQTLFILLQAADALPTNIWTVGGALALFAGVITYLFKLYDSSQEKRLTEMRTNLEGQINGLKNDLADEKQARRNLQDQFNSNIMGQLNKSTIVLERVEDLLNNFTKR